MGFVCFWECLLVPGVEKNVDTNPKRFNSGVVAALVAGGGGGGEESEGVECWKTGDKYRVRFFQSPLAEQPVVVKCTDQIFFPSPLSRVVALLK